MVGYVAAISTGDVVVGKGRYIATVEGMVGYGDVHCRFLLGTMLQRMILYISTWEGVVGYDAVYLYLRRCGRLPQCRSLLGTVQ